MQAVQLKDLAEQVAALQTQISELEQAKKDRDEGFGVLHDEVEQLKEFTGFVGE